MDFLKKKEILKKSTCIFRNIVLIYLSALKSAYAPIAQLDRVTDYESVGRGFESLSAYHETDYPIWDNPFHFSQEKGTRRSKRNSPVDCCLPPVSTAATP